MEELQAQVHSMDGAKGWYERRLKEAEESLQQQQQEQEGALKQCREQHASELKSKEEELLGLQGQLQQAQEERDSHLETISNLKQVTCPSTVPCTPWASSCSDGAGRECITLPSPPFSASPAFSISQEVKDTMDGQRILEKKGSAVV